ncbi:MAG: AsmA family protein [Minwuia sp.]|uniref:AsmA family protein n=1 Tax=Minwuia sp. TaxID=2493630 RepID=UPI003A8A9529
MRILLILVSVLAIAVAGLLFAAPALVNAGDYRDDIERTASEVLGQPVQINGALEFSILPTPRLLVRDVRVGPPRGRPDLLPVLASPQMEFVFSLSGLLGGRLIADDLRIASPDVVIQTSLAGHSNHGITLEGSGSIRHVGFEGGRFRLLDQKTGRQVEIAEVSGEIEHDAARGLVGGGGSAVWRGRAIQLEIRSTTAQRTSFIFDMLVENAGRLVYRGRITDAATMRSEGRIELTSDDLGGLRDLLVIAPAGDEAVPARLQGHAVVEPGGVRVEGLDGLIGGAQAGGRIDIAFGERIGIDAAVALEQINGERLRAWANRLTDAALAAGAADDGSWPVAVKLRADLGLIAFREGFVRQFALTSAYRDGKLTVERAAALLPGGSDVAFAGDVRLAGGAFRLAGSVEAASDNLAGLSAWLGAPVAAEGHGRLRNMTASAQLMVSSGVAQISEIDLRVDQSRVTGGVAIALVRRPSFSTNLVVDQINLNAYAPLLGAEDVQAADIVGDLTEPRLPFLGEFDTNLTLRAGRLIFGPSVARDVEIDAALIGGVLDIKTLAFGDLDGASLNVAGRIDTPENPQVLLKGTLQAPTLAAGLQTLRIPPQPSLGRLREVAADFAIEGGLNAFGLDVDLRTLELGGRIVGRVSNAFETPEFDFDLSLTGSNTGAVASALFPGQGWTGRLAGPLLVEARINGRAERLDIAGKLDAMSARLDATGQFGSLTDHRTYDFNVRLRHGDGIVLAQSLWPDYAPPRPLSAPLDLSAHVSGGAASVSLADIAALHGETSFGGEMTVDWGGDRPRLDAALTGVVLDLDAYLPQGRYGAAAVAGSGDRSRRWSRLPVRATGLTGWDGVVEAGFERLSAAGLAMGPGSMALQLDRARIDLKSLDAAIGGGRIEARAALDLAETPSLNLSLDINDASTAAWIGPFAGLADGPAGTGDIALTVAGTGVTPYDLVGSLEGQGRIGDLTLIWADAEGDRSLQDLAGEIVVTGGVLRAGELLTGSMNGEAVELRGSIDLPDWTAEMEIVPADGGVLLFRGRPDQLELQSGS